MTFKKEEVLICDTYREFWKATGDLIVDLSKLDELGYFEGYVPVKVCDGTSSILKVKVPSIEVDLNTPYFEQKFASYTTCVLIHPTVSDIYGDDIYRQNRATVIQELKDIRAHMYNDIPFGISGMEYFMDKYALTLKDIEGIIDEKDIRKWQNKVR
jgi:hypothetical protein